MTSPKAKTPREGEKKGMKIAQTIQTMKNIMVLRQPKRSCAHVLINRPVSWPTRAELERPDCHDGVMPYVPGLEGTGVPKRRWNCSWP